MAVVVRCLDAGVIARLAAARPNEERRFGQDDALLRHEVGWVVAVERTSLHLVQFADALVGVCNGDRILCRNESLLKLVAGVVGEHGLAVDCI